MAISHTCGCKSATIVTRIVKTLKQFADISKLNMDDVMK